MNKKIALMQDEYIICTRPIHWKNYILVSILMLAAIILLSVRMAFPDKSLVNSMTTTPIIDDTIASVFMAIEVFALCLIIARLYVRIIRVCTIRYFVTNKRIIKVSGFLTKQKTEMLISRCETVLMKENIYERIFNCGDLLCLAPGSQILLDDVKDVEEFKLHIMELINKRKDAERDKD